MDGHNRKCNGFSYSENTQVCLLSPYGLNYEKDYDYYEKNPEKKTVETKVTDPKTGLVTLVKKEVPVSLDGENSHEHHTAPTQLHLLP